MKLADKKVLVIGMGKSGRAAAKFLAANKAKVTICDINDSHKLKTAIDDLRSLPIDIMAGAYPSVKEKQIELILISPGIPLTIDPVKEAEALGIPVIGEMELAYRFCDAPIVAITGTNGKTTTTALTGQIFKDADYPSAVGGNIGTALLEVIRQVSDNGVVIAEVSSFQLETTEFFKPKIAAVLNLTPDHLDRHKTFENYVDAKTKIFKNQSPDDYTVLNYDDPKVRQLEQLSEGKVIFFSRQHILNQGVFVMGEFIVAKVGETEEKVCKISEVSLRGEHNLENILAATTIATLSGIDSNCIKGTLKSFAGVSHRLEKVEIVDGVEYINDSKATNPDASIKAVLAFDKPIVLIAGGMDKGSDFISFMETVKPKLKSLIVLGETASKLEAAANQTGFNNVKQVKNYEEAVKLAANISKTGDVVLLSPACASWDMFSNFEERGEMFKKLVLDLRG